MSSPAATLFFVPLLLPLPENPKKNIGPRRHSGTLGTYFCAAAFCLEA